MIKLVGKKYYEKHGFSIVSKYLPTRYFRIIKGETVSRQCTNLAYNILIRWSTWTSPVIRHGDIMHPWWNAVRRAQHNFSIFLSKNAKSRSKREKSLDKPKWGTFYKITDQYPPEVSRSWKTKIRERIETWQPSTMHDPGLDSGPEEQFLQH